MPLHVPWTAPAQRSSSHPGLPPPESACSHAMYPPRLPTARLAAPRLDLIKALSTAAQASMATRGGPEHLQRHSSRHRSPVSMGFDNVPTPFIAPRATCVTGPSSRKVRPLAARITRDHLPSPVLLDRDDEQTSRTPPQRRRRSPSRKVNTFFFLCVARRRAPHRLSTARLFPPSPPARSRSSPYAAPASATSAAASCHPSSTAAHPILTRAVSSARLAWRLAPRPPIVHHRLFLSLPPPSRVVQHDAPSSSHPAHTATPAASAPSRAPTRDPR
ncbi:hypothetical protein POSPLADRAFT_1053366 [Postia placenta MAD-698-R-SB12]|uniref:Uncharacterized protein n=1 Tax=Postia placenta MAD-698-R-SB12 TaxID=670580 RepID=A0A1X6NE10_9APHY|nr:hypothetical protein POSPLADRAFT_1053366 [Postia placenta MAD-698-R-SB12]OSX66750.1 hypothetical protein POSPLADRAFT_1053366 [Postia placenta MAD-698-R-SB12]